MNPDLILTRAAHTSVLLALELCAMLIICLCGGNFQVPRVREYGSTVYSKVNLHHSQEFLSGKILHVSSEYGDF